MFRTRHTQRMDSIVLFTDERSSKAWVSIYLEHYLYSLQIDDEYNSGFENEFVSCKTTDKNCTGLFA